MALWLGDHVLQELEDVIQLDSFDDLVLYQVQVPCILFDLSYIVSYLVLQLLYLILLLRYVLHMLLKLQLEIFWQTK